MEKVFQDVLSQVTKVVDPLLLLVKEEAVKYPSIVGFVAAISTVVVVGNIGIIWWKIRFTAFSWLYMIVSRDAKKKRTAPSFPPQTLPHGHTITWQTQVIFIRHGESAWNQIFNVPPKIFAPIRLIIALIRECFIFMSYDSLFFDSPLNMEGLKQAQEVEAEIQKLKEQDKFMLHKQALYVTSNLRRAMTTLFLSFRKHFMATDAKIYMLSELQEISRNVDTQALAAAKTQHPVPDKLLQSFDPDVATMMGELDLTYYEGGKTLSSNGVERIVKFTQRVYEMVKKTRMACVVVGGHSLWFRSFFRLYLPEYSQARAGTLPMEASTKKIMNGGMVKFTLQRVERNDGKPAYFRIDPNSILEMIKGFEGKDKRKKKQ